MILSFWWSHVYVSNAMTTWQIVMRVIKIWRIRTPIRNDFPCIDICLSDNHLEISHYVLRSNPMTNAMCGLSETTSFTYEKILLLKLKKRFFFYFHSFGSHVYIPSSPVATWQILIGCSPIPTHAQPPDTDQSTNSQRPVTHQGSTSQQSVNHG